MAEVTPLIQNYTEQQLTTMEADLRALRALAASRGWVIVQERLKDDIVEAAFGMAGLMSEKERDFRAGAMHAARGALGVVDALIERAESDLKLAALSRAAHTPNASA